MSQAGFRILRIPLRLWEGVWAPRVVVDGWRVSETGSMLGSEVLFNPAVLLAMWAAGILGSGAVVARLRITGAGYLWLTVGTAVLAGGGAWLFDPGPVAVAALLIAAVAGSVGRKSHVAGALMAVSAAAFFLVAARGSFAISALTGSVALGAITSGMLLGHWYLVDPRIPRRPLQHLAVAGAAGVVLDAAAVLGPTIPPADSAVLAVVSLGLAAVSCLLMVAVWFALRYPSYSGVMAATGLSYLAILTCLGSLTMARVVAEGALALR